MVAILTPVLAAASCSSGSGQVGVVAAQDSAAVIGTTGQYSDEAIREKWLSEQAVFFNIDDPPEVELIRYITAEESKQVMRDCFAAAGFVQDPNGGVFVADDQTTSYDLAGYTCAAKYQMNPAYYRPLTTRQLDVLYDYYRDSYIPCVAEFDVDLAEIPTRQVFRSTYGTMEWWSPRLPSTLTWQESVAITSACPASPPFDVLYG